MAVGRIPGVLAGVLVTSLAMAASAGAFGTFKAAHTYMTGVSVFGVAVADMNRDGNPDILAGGDNDVDSPKNHVSYFRGRGDGTFKKAVKIPDLGGPEGVVTGRFNGDKIPDFATAEYESGHVAVFYGMKKGGFRRDPQKLDDLAGPWLLASGDLNGDGRPDLVAGNYSGDGSNAVTVFLGKPKGKFKAGVDYAGGGVSSNGLGVAKLGPDKRLDVVVADGNGTVDLLNGKGDGTLGTPQQVNDASGELGFTGLGYGLAIGTFDHQFPDVAVGVQSTSNLNDHVDASADVGWTLPVTKPSSSPGAPRGIAAADFNRDGFDDLAVGRSATGESGFNLLRSNRDGTFALKPSGVYPGSAVAEWVATGNLNADKAPDVIVATDTGIDVYLNKK
jgi:hypothetical protein